MEESWSRRKNAIKRGRNDYQPGPSETLQREREEMETRLKEIATGQKLNLKREQKNRKIVTQLIKLDALKTRRFTNKIITNYSLAKLI